MTRRTKRLLATLVVVLVALGGFGAFVHRGRGTSSVEIAERNLAAARKPAAGATGTAAVAAAPVATPTAPARPTAATRRELLARALTARAKRAAANITPAPATPAAQPTPAATIPAGPTSSVKKGASIFGSPEGLTGALADSGVSWTYNWAAAPNGIAAPEGVEYVPMIWGADAADDATLAQAQQNGSTLLGFNEPDFADQADLTVEQALDLWPRLEATNLRLGSPAVATGADQDGQWLDRFMTGAAKRGYRVDFIAVHWYGGDFNPTRATSQLRSYLRATYAKYHKPIWITEYALMNFATSERLPSPEVQAEFVTRSTAMLERLPYVERYAWFAFPTPSDGTDGTGLYRPGGIATLPGQAYRLAGR